MDEASDVCNSVASCIYTLMATDSSITGLLLESGSLQRLLEKMLSQIGMEPLLKTSFMIVDKIIEQVSCNRSENNFL